MNTGKSVLEMLRGFAGLFRLSNNLFLKGNSAAG